MTINSTANHWAISQWLDLLRKIENIPVPCVFKKCEQWTIWTLWKLSPYSMNWFVSIWLYLGCEQFEIVNNFAPWISTIIEYFESVKYFKLCDTYNTVNNLKLWTILYRSENLLRMIENIPVPCVFKKCEQWTIWTLWKISPYSMNCFVSIWLYLGCEQFEIVNNFEKEWESIYFQCCEQCEH